ncbi:MAG: VWA domain-containing protein [Lachnospiraceae bacterium]|nr:VWA domain-containing protein [Lachnospiraceae bacterium]
MSQPIGNKTVSTNEIPCRGTLTVTLSVEASPNINENPADMVLVLDRSGSMEGEPLANLKLGAKAFVDIIDENTDGQTDGQIGGGSRIGVVSFSDDATQDTQLITSVDDLKDAIDDLVSNGRTNHVDAFNKAIALLSAVSDNQKIIIMFTDGETTVGGSADAIAEAAKALGIQIYVIGLTGNGGINIDALTAWASSPKDEFLRITPNAAELVELFENLAQTISGPGATDIVIEEELTEDFTLVSIGTPSHGAVEQTGDRTFVWRIDELGVTADETATVSFVIRHTGVRDGVLEVNEDVTYSDSEDHEVDFPSPSVLVDCDDEVIVIPEPCPVPMALTVEGCRDALVFTEGEVLLSSLGRIVEVDVTIRSVCPGKRVALALLLYEVTDEGLELSRGVKTMVIPAHDESSCRDVLVRCVKFVLPETLDTAGTPNAICDERNLHLKAIAHYIDTDFVCCGMVTVVE